MREEKVNLLIGAFVLLVFFILDVSGVTSNSFPGAVVGVFFSLLFLM